jgi:inorganic phosphate transporter, PiT family
VAVGGIGCGLAIYAASRRNPVSALNVNDVPPASPARAVA